MDQRVFAALLGSTLLRRRIFDTAMGRPKAAAVKSMAKVQVPVTEKLLKARRSSPKTPKKQQQPKAKAKAGGKPEVAVPTQEQKLPEPTPAKSAKDVEDSTLVNKENLQNLDTLTAEAKVAEVTGPGDVAAAVADPDPKPPSPAPEPSAAAPEKVEVEGGDQGKQELEQEHLDARLEAFPFPDIRVIANNASLDLATDLMTSPALKDSRFKVLQRMFRWPFYMLDVFNRFLCMSAAAADGPRATTGNTMSRSLSAQTAAAVAREANRGLAGVVAPGDHVRERVGATSSAEAMTAKGNTLQGFVDRMSSSTISTSYSGVDTPMIATLQLAWAANSELGCPHDVWTSSPKNLFAVELAVKCREELATSPHPPQHIFRDLTEFFQPHIKNRIPSIVRSDLVHTVLVPLVTSGSAMRREAYCTVHDCMCQAGACRSRSLSLSKV